MISLSIGTASEIYANASRCEIVRHWIDHPELEEVSKLQRALHQSLGDESEDDFWRHTLGPIRKLAFAYCSVPLPFSQAVGVVGTDWKMVNRQVHLCERIYPDAHQALQYLANKLETLSAENDSPLISPLEDLLEEGGKIAVMIRNPRMNKATAASFAGNPRLRKAIVVSPAQLRGAHLCDVLATIGPCAWFPEYVFAAPRAQAIHIISYRWIRDGWKPGPSFLHDSTSIDCTNNFHSIGEMPKVAHAPTIGTPIAFEIQPEELLPRLPSFHKAIGANGQPAIGGEETVPARLCHLSGDRAVFIASDEGATSLIIDSTGNGRPSVRRVPTEELETGFYILLRTAGGGDLVAPFADRIMGDLAVKRRSQQSEWKRQVLSKAVERFGQLDKRGLSSQVASELCSLQLADVRPANVHYWMSAKCISPRKLEDFSAILTFAGLEEQTNEFWTAMDEIDRAHRKAGFLIRRMLLQRISETSLEPLERDGEMDFELGEHGGGTLSAIQVMAIEEEVFEIPVERIGVILDVGD